MHKEYPKYIFKGVWLALVYSAEERALLPDWQDTPPEGFVCPNHADFNGAHEVLAANLAPIAATSVSEDEGEDEDEDENEDEEKSVPGVSPKKTFSTDHERIIHKTAVKQRRMEQRMAALRAKAEQ